MVTRPLRLVVKRSVGDLPLAERGRSLDASQVATEVFGGHVTRRWVLDHVPREYRYPIGRLILYYEHDVREWRETLRGAA